MKFTLNEYGFITNYLVSGCKETPFSSEVTDKNQLRCEKLMRDEVADHEEAMPQGTIAVGLESALGTPWKYHYTHGSWFVDSSTFYPLLTKVEFDAATVLEASQDMEVTAWLWSFAAIDVWVNGKLAGGIKTPVYKPINREVLTLPLKKGENLIYVRLQNLGVRDTRSLFAIQIPGVEKDRLSVSLPDMEHAGVCAELGEWLSGISIEGSRLVFPSKAPEGCRLVYDSRPVDFTKYKDRYTYEDAAGKTEIALKDDGRWFSVEAEAMGQKLSRAFVRQDLMTPSYSGVTDQKENEERVYERIASVGQIPRGSGSFSMYPILGRYYTGNIDPDDEKEIYKSFDQIESRMDCSDFLSCAMVRFMKLYLTEESSFDEKLKKRCREVMTNYRYWMDGQGNDGMCFWSENHSLMFFVSAYVAGEIYPDDWFVRSGKIGREMKEQARVRIHDWMVSSIEEGFDEFHSGGYTPITFCAILNVIDFCDEELSELAWKAADRLLTDLAVQTFKGVSIAPMGRVYGEVLYPYAQSIQCLVNLLDPEAPDEFSEWIIFLATSKYELPEGLDRLMKEPASLVYGESNARIRVEKTEDYMMTSVESPRTDGKARTWENISGREETAVQEPDSAADMGSFAYVKSLNECFHGTTQFEPGVFGYQQHMWYAALDPAAVLFVNHPGSSCEICSTRPGYWFGNGIMPALKQVKNKLYGIYQIPETHPIPFTHLYWPESKFEEQVKEDNWIAGKKGNGYAAVWCSTELRPHNDQMFHCEYRADSRNAAYFCVCGSGSEYDSLEVFLEACRAMKPAYDEESGTLTAAGESLVYTPYENLTQYI